MYPHLPRPWNRTRTARRTEAARARKDLRAYDNLMATGKPDSPSLARIRALLRAQAAIERALADELRDNGASRYASSRSVGLKYGLDTEALAAVVANDLVDRKRQAAIDGAQPVIPQPSMNSLKSLLP